MSKVQITRRISLAGAFLLLAAVLALGAADPGPAFAHGVHVCVNVSGRMKATAGSSCPTGQALLHLATQSSIDTLSAEVAALSNPFLIGGGTGDKKLKKDEQRLVPLFNAHTEKPDTAEKRRKATNAPPDDILVSNLKVSLSKAPGADKKDYQFTLVYLDAAGDFVTPLDADAEVPLRCTIADAAVQCNDDDHVVLGLVRQ